MEIIVSSKLKIDISLGIDKPFFPSSLIRFKAMTSLDVIKAVGKSFKEFSFEDKLSRLLLVTSVSINHSFENFKLFSEKNSFTPKSFIFFLLAPINPIFRWFKL